MPAAAAEKLAIVPVTLRQARAFVAAHHRHTRPPRSHLFGVGLARPDGSLTAVAIAGRPVSRTLDDGRTVEVTRVCTVGDRNACSRLYGACCRAAAAVGYRKAITYTLASECAASVRAAGFVFEADVRADTWERPGRVRAARTRDLFGGEEKYDPGPKKRWGRILNP